MAKATTADSAAIESKVTKSDKPVKTGKPGKAPSAEKPNFFAKMVGYFRDVRAEMKRVVWPTRAEVLNSSVVVITTLIFFIAFITLTDLLVVQILKLIAKLG
jgi:preprotein translocase subunit SecE